jgi:hypothetical protein
MVTAPALNCIQFADFEAVLKNAISLLLASREKQASWPAGFSGENFL